jgi:hypothetical protein
MKKSILDQFASDAINSPAVVTGGTGCGAKPKSGKSHKSHKAKSHKSHKSKKSGCGC